MSIYSASILFLYLLTISSVFFTRFLNLKIGNFLAFIVSFISFLAAAVRPMDFPDLDTYEIMYEFAAAGNFNDPSYWAAHGEPGFKIFCYFLSLLGINFSGFLIIISLISFFLLIYIARLGKVPFSYLWFAYFSFFFITRDMGIIRMAIASHLILIFFLQRKLIWQSISILLASISFQYFAIVAILVKPFSRVKIDWFSISLLFVVSFALSGLISFENIKFILSVEQVNNYSETDIVQPGTYSTIIPIFRNLFFAFFIYLLMRNEINYRKYRLWIWAAFFSVSFYILASGILVVAQRFSAYFGVIFPIAMAFIMNRNTFKIDSFLLVIFVCILNFASLFYFNSWLWK